MAWPAAPYTVTAPARTVTRVLSLLASVSTRNAPGCVATRASCGVSSSTRWSAGTSRTRKEALPCVRAHCVWLSSSAVASSAAGPCTRRLSQPPSSSRRAPASSCKRVPVVTGQLSAAGAQWPASCTRTAPSSALM